MALVVVVVAGCGSSPAGEAGGGADDLVALRVANLYPAGLTCWDNGPPEFVAVRGSDGASERIDVDADGEPEFVRSDGVVAFRSSLVPGLRSEWTAVDLDAASPAVVNLLTVTAPGVWAPSMFDMADPFAALATVQQLEADGRRSPVAGSEIGREADSFAWEAEGSVVQRATIDTPREEGEPIGVEEVRLERVAASSVVSADPSPAVPVAAQPVAPLLATAVLADETCGGEVDPEAYVACVRDLARDLTVEEWMSSRADDVLGETACRGR